MADGELCLIDKNISSLLEVPLSSSVTSLNLHCNRISRLEGLTSAWRLRHLDLSSNHITRIEGLGSLTSLRTLNLSCNLITKVEGLNGLVNLTRLNVSYNHISDLTGLLYLHGAEYKLKHLSLHSNRLGSINQVLQCMLGLLSLREISLCVDGKDNPLCSSPCYREMVFQALPQISSLDRVDRLGNHTSLGEDCPIDIPGLDDYVDFLLSSDTSANDLARGDRALTTPRINEVMSQYRQRAGPVEPTPPTRQTDPLQVSPAADPYNEQRIQKLEQQVSQLFHQKPLSQKPTGDANSNSAPSVELRKPKRDIDNTSESDCDSGKESRRGPRMAAAQQRRGRATVKRPVKEAGARRTHSDPERRKGRGSKCAAGTWRKAGGPCAAPGPADMVGPARKGLNPPRAPGDRSSRSTGEEETYRAIVEERDQERERRWKAEQAVRKLTEQMKSLQTQASEEKDLQSLALHTTDRLKELLLRERSERSGLQARVEELEERSQGLALQLEQARQQEDHQQRALRSLEDSVAHKEALRARQQAEEMKRQQELENKAAAMKREVEIHKAMAKQHKDKQQQLHELLASREQVYRKDLESRLVPGGTEFREAVAKEAESAERRHAQRVSELEERLAEGKQQYAALEDEFRMALTIEATRFTEVKEGYDHLSVEVSEVRAALARSQQREKQSGSLVQDLTAMVKEQKNRIAELIKSKKDAITELKARLRPLEAGVEQDRRLNLQLELMKKDKSRLLAQLSAQESVIDGLRAERKIWGQELAQQGASLAQDRGRLEAKIEVLSTELESQKKQNERDNDALRIKAKVIDDQTETIRKLKEAVQERDEQVRRLREESVQAQRRFQQQLEEETGPLVELRDRLEQLSLRKEELKQQLEDKELELDEVKRAYSASNKKWQEKADLLTRLESQVKRMKDKFDSKETLLLEERDKASEAHKAVVEKLHSMDDAFRRQLECVQVSHQTELLRLANEKQKQIEQANQSVFQVEEEMRQLLEETESSKKTMEDKMRRLTSVLKDF
ncbi:leucine-rich repeat and coiled-coil domain-containing protein 1 isoform X2 [Hypomesus transpacificus]|uniref:leucine-rich repeat and coiled-coil domain-containing protein 1 isoform X2 n=1 Tax=Hypomesus transpacificus TaxID=137520 RepID=UPI001F080472|nr:leucine-rich repeat and coiled-coil domain-containing protein 1 isoform X2 [Hypomesus transpacificus]